jgi:hypothetical protein
MSKIMAKKRLVTWKELAKIVLRMNVDEQNSPVLMCGDEWYCGLEADCVRHVPDYVDLSKEEDGNIGLNAPLLMRKKYVKPGRTYIQL